MSAATIIYLGEVFQMIDVISGVGVFISLIIGGISFLVMCNHPEILPEKSSLMNERDVQTHKAAKKIYKTSMWIFIPLLSLSILLPNGNTFYLMTAAQITQDMAVSSEAKEIGNKLLKVINQKLDEQIKDTK